MSTERIYYEDPYLNIFTATVTGCRPAEGKWHITLDRTAFFPEGGGQPCDIGTLGTANVLDVQEMGNEVIHTADRPLAPGEQIMGVVDWPRRFDLTQQHSGEHIVSGLIHSKYGYNNVGFHLGSEVVTIDFDGELTPEMVNEVEVAANQLIYENWAVDIFYPDSAELARLDYRSKKAIDGAVRIVRFPGGDVCACCGTHVRRTGEIGQVKIISCQKFRSGSRLELLCGRRALDYCTAILAQNARISSLLSAKPTETAEAVARMQGELAELRARLGEIEAREFSHRASILRGVGDVLLFEEAMAPDSICRLAARVMESCGGRCAVFSGEEGNYRYAIGQQDGQLKQLTIELNRALNGQGGGKPNFVQGSVRATRREIEDFFREKG